MGEDKPGDPIVPPAANDPTDRVRTVLSAVVDTIGGGGLTRLFDEAVATNAQKAQAAWADSISTRTNEITEQVREHESLLNPQVSLEGAVETIVVALVQSCPDGRGLKTYSKSEISRLVPRSSSDDVDEYIATLQRYGLIEVSYYTGSEWHLRIMQRLYEQLDWQFMGWNTLDDAAMLAKMVLAGERAVAPVLHNATGWSLRRFSPAWKHLVAHIGPGRVSQEKGTGYSNPSFSPLAEDRVALRQLVKSRPSAL